MHGFAAHRSLENRGGSPQPLDSRRLASPDHIAHSFYDYDIEGEEKKQGEANLQARWRSSGALVGIQGGGTIATPRRSIATSAVSHRRPLDSRAVRLRRSGNHHVSGRLHPISPAIGGRRSPLARPLLSPWTAR